MHPRGVKTWLIGSRRSAWIKTFRLAVIVWPGIHPLTSNPWFLLVMRPHLATNLAKRLCKVNKQHPDNKPKIESKTLQVPKIKKILKHLLIRLYSFTVWIRVGVRKRRRYANLNTVMTSFSRVTKVRLMILLGLLLPDALFIWLQLRRQIEELWFGVWELKMHSLHNYSGKVNPNSK